MNSFRTELESPAQNGHAVIEKDIAQLAEKIQLFREGKIDPEKFRSIRLARGVYGQRQQGVQMVRIKIPQGKINVAQLRRLADLSDEYSTGNLHLTTRQDVQLHFVSLERTPQLWDELERDALTLREACGNTVRNITVSSLAGIDPDEPFDVSPYADALFRHFLRNPVQQDLGRKIKISFSSSDNDTAVSFIHDLGFIPKAEIIEGNIVRGFKVLLGGGLGAQPIPAQVAFEFLPADELIPFSEALIRVFDRHGERNNRQKARLKYLVAKTGFNELLRLVAVERAALLKNKHVVVPVHTVVPEIPGQAFTTLRVSNDERFRAWKSANTFEQKQQGWFGVYVKIPQGNILSGRVRVLAGIAEKYAAGDLRITIGQSFLLRFVHEAALPALYRELNVHGFSAIGANAFADITSCPGTDTCNLAISNSTGVSAALEEVIVNEFPQLAIQKELSVKISGCMNSCGQHAVASIGFHGSSVKTGNDVVPALQLLLGGGTSGNGEGRVADKILKFPSKRATAVLRTLLTDFTQQQQASESFLAYYDRKGKDYFYQLLKAFSSAADVKAEELIDWGQESRYATQIGVGECAGVKIDLTATLLFEAKETLQAADENFIAGRYSDATYKAYNVFIHAAKALLLKRDVQVNTQQGIINDFDKHFHLRNARSSISGLPFRDLVTQISSSKAEKTFANKYINEARLFLELVPELEKQTLHPDPKLN